MNIHVARQPIFDRNLHVYGYELLYREGSTVNEFGQTAADEASSQVIVDSFYSFGIDQLTEGKRAFINFTSNMLDCEIATLFPKDILTIEILETVEIETSVIEKCRQLKEAGYMLALDDFVFSEQYLPLLEFVDIIKIDFLNVPLGDMFNYINRFKREGLSFLAEKIELKEAFDLAVAIGFDYFQGYFFSRPVIISGSDVRPLEVNYLRLIYETNKRTLAYRNISDIITSDVSLTYRLLRLVNSVAQGFLYPIRSIHHALVALGEAEVRKWVSLIAMMGINSNQPEELLHLSLIRAKFAEQLGFITGQSDDAPNLFMMGLFSMLDTIMGRTFEDIFKEIYIPNSVRDALVNHKGRYGLYYSLIYAHERGEWDFAMQFASKLRLTENDLTTAYVEALRWCSMIFAINNVD